MPVILPSTSDPTNPISISAASPLSRILDNVHQLDLKLPALDPEHIFRIEYIDNGMVYDMPAWADESLKYKNKIAELERQLEEALNARGTA